MKYTIIDIEHFKSEASVVRGIKERDFKKFSQNHKVYAGSNGSYVTAGVPAFTNVKLKDENGEHFTINAIDELKDITDNRRFTEKFISQLNTKLSGKTFEVEKNDDFRSSLYNFFKDNI